MKNIRHKHKNKIKKHWKRAIKHVHKHHKKYLLGSVGYYIAHLFMFKLLFLKLLAFKFGIAWLISLGLFNQNQFITFAGLEPICVNSPNILEELICQDSYKNLQDGLSSLERKLKFEQSNIDNFDYHGEFKNTLTQHCDGKLIAATNKWLSVFAIGFDKKLSTYPESQQLKYFVQLYDKLKTYNLKVPQNNFNNYCKKKYLLHGLQWHFQSKYKQILKKNNLYGNKLIRNQLDKSKTEILEPLIDKQLQTIQTKHSSAEFVDEMNIHNIAYQWQGNPYSQALKTKVIKLTDAVVKDIFQSFIDDKLFSPKDVKYIQDKLEIQYMRGCTKTKWAYTVTRKLSSDGEVLSANLDKLVINVNFCPSYQYINNLSYYIQQIMVHELWHHVYYFKDSKPTQFEDICRDNKNSHHCDKQDFVSRYSQTYSEEDYAETFLHRYLKIDRRSSLSPILTKKRDHFSQIKF